jgi:diguanylate cyclase (GGDEF)-like protein
MINKNKPTMLIVDDTVENLQLLSGLLAMDYIVKVATNGERALEIANSAKELDLILLDIMMPEMDGYEVCRRLKSNTITSEIPLIFVSANNEVEDQMKGFNLGAVDYIVKPFELPLIKARIKTHIQLRQKTKMLEELAMIDGLTGIANRRRFDEVYKSEFSRAARNNKSLSLLMIDIDYFKFYNDGYGHGAGDECLVKVASQLHETLTRTSDFVGRYGGEEFVIILPDIDAQGAIIVAQKLKENVEMLKILHEYSKVSRHITISIGCASITPRSDSNSADLLKLADEQLYKAKETGRNRVSY